MRKIQAGDVHALENQTPENFFGLAGRAEGTDNLGFTHGFSLPVFWGAEKNSR
jgi:hypothetical protein